MISPGLRFGLKRRCSGDSTNCIRTYLYGIPLHLLKLCELVDGKVKSLAFRLGLIFYNLGQTTILLLYRGDKTDLKAWIKK